MEVKSFLLVYFNLLLGLSLIYCISTNRQVNQNRVLSFFLVTFVVTMYTYRSRYGFGDTNRYLMLYEWMEKAPSMEDAKDYGFTLLTYYLSFLHNDRMYLFVISFLYVVPIYFVIRQKFSEYLFLLLLLIICSFSFLGFGTNGLRNGLASTFLIVAFLTKDRKLQIIWCVVAFFFHKSSLLPISIFIIASFYNKPKKFLYFWVICFFLSLLTRNAIEPILDIIDKFNNDVASAAEVYLEGDYDNFDVGHFSHTGYRWDFVIYSVVPLYLGWYYIFKCKFQDDLYNVLYCVYVGANAFWLFTIYVPFNNRFAYLSWFLYPIVISYPLIKHKDLVTNQDNKIKLMVFLNMSFTYFMYMR